MCNMSNLMVERVEAMVGRAAERVERVSGKERVVEIGAAVMVKGRVGVIVLSPLVSLNNLVCTVQVVVSVLRMSRKLLWIMCFPNPVFLMVMLLTYIVTQIYFIMFNKKPLNDATWLCLMCKIAGATPIMLTILTFITQLLVDQNLLSRCCYCGS